MKCEETDGLLADFLLGDLPPEEAARLEEHLAACPACMVEVESLRAVWNEMGLLGQEQPAPALRARFYEMLRQEKAGQARRPWRDLWAMPWLRRPLLQAAGVAAVLALGWFAGLRAGSRGGEIAGLRQEVRSLNHLVTLSLLEQPSASERLRGVAFGRVTQGSDAVVLAALLEAATRDPNVNVRLAAIDALAPLAVRRDVREELMGSFALQPSPLVQIALVDAVVQSGGAEAERVLRPLLEERRLDPAVREHLQTSLGIRG